MLKAGGTKHHKELLAPFGLDATRSRLLADGPVGDRGLIDELEALEGSVIDRPLELPSLPLPWPG